MPKVHSRDVKARWPRGHFLTLQFGKTYLVALNILIRAVQAITGFLHGSTRRGMQSAGSPHAFALVDEKKLQGYPIPCKTHQVCENMKGSKKKTSKFSLVVFHGVQLQHVECVRTGSQKNGE